MSDPAQAGGMTRKEVAAAARRLEDCLSELLAPLGRSERRRWARTYVQGLRLAGGTQIH